MGLKEKKKGKKVMQITWSDTKSCKSSEKESNGSKECTNFTTFVASVSEEPPMKKALSKSFESSYSNGDKRSFDFAYETLYEECLSLQQEQTKWKASKKNLTNVVNALKGRKEVFT